MGHSGGQGIQGVLAVSLTFDLHFLPLRLLLVGST
jgi:hypothetical protein